MNRAFTGSNEISGFLLIQLGVRYHFLSYINLASVINGVQKLAPQRLLQALLRAQSELHLTAAWPRKYVL